MRTLRILVFLLFLLSTMKVVSQNEFTAHLFDIRMVSDSVSRYSEPKISPDGTRILTSRNRNTLIYIDLENGIEVELLTANGSFSKYYWIDSNQIYFYRTIKSKSDSHVELGKMTLNPLEIQIEFDSRYDKSSGSVRRIPYLKQGKYDVFNHARNRKVYKVEKNEKIEITHEAGVYFELVVSNNAERIIVHKNDGKAYNYDLKGSGEHFFIAQGIVTSWSPNDNYLLYFQSYGGEHRADFTSELYICTSDGKQHQKLTNTDYLREFDPDWALNSDKIAFIDDKSSQIYIGRIIIE